MKLADQTATMADDLQSGSAAAAAGPVSDGDTVVAYGPRASGAIACLQGFDVVQLQSVEVSGGVPVVATTAVVTDDSGAASDDFASREAVEEGAADGKGDAIDLRVDSLPSQGASEGVEPVFVLHQVLGDLLVCLKHRERGRRNRRIRRCQKSCGSVVRVHVEY